MADCICAQIILWPPDAKNWLIGKDSDARKDWRQEEKGMREDEMVGWHHRLSGHEFEQAPKVGDGQGSLRCCSPWGCKELDTTEWMNWTELNWCLLWGNVYLSFIHFWLGLLFFVFLYWVLWGIYLFWILTLYWTYHLQIFPLPFNRLPPWLALSSQKHKNHPAASGLEYVWLWKGGEVKYSGFPSPFLITLWSKQGLKYLFGSQLYLILHGRLDFRFRVFSFGKALFV